MPPEAVAAFFDFDRTVVDGDAGVLFGRELIRLRRRRVRDLNRGTVGWAGRNLAYEARTARLLLQGTFLKAGSDLHLLKRSHVIRTGYRFLRGVPLEDLRELAHDFFEEVLAARIFPAARAEVERHRGEGRRVVVVSTGMHLLIDHVQRHLPVDDVIAVTLVDHEGVLTGQVRGPLWGREKARAVRAYAHARGLSLPKSYAYSDHASDLKFLQLVGHPVAVNPDLRLKLHARRRGWPLARWLMNPA